MHYESNTKVVLQSCSELGQSDEVSSKALSFTELERPHCLVQWTKVRT